MHFSWDYLSTGTAKEKTLANYYDGGKTFSWSVEPIGVGTWIEFLNLVPFFGWNLEETSIVHRALSF